jgi:uncharacterized protein (TIGR00106 family)
VTGFALYFLVTGEYRKGGNPGMRGFVMAGFMMLMTLAASPGWAEPPSSPDKAPAWTVALARETLFDGAFKTMDLKAYAAVDPDYLLHQPVIQQGGGRSGQYYVQVLGNRQYYLLEPGRVGLLYLHDGSLAAVERFSGADYPVRAYKYLYGYLENSRGLREGDLLNATLHIGPAERYVFSADGRLRGHWLGAAAPKRISPRLTRQNRFKIKLSFSSGVRCMQVMVDLCVVPLSVGVSLSKYIVECERILQEAGLTTQLHAYGTNIEGEWDDVFAAIKRCHERIHEMGVQTMQDKIDSVKQKLETP